GNVSLSADGDIVQSSAGTQAVVTGNRIDLVSRSGGIGTNAQPLNVQSGSNELAGVNASALGDIALRQPDGDFRLIQIRSIDGDVWIEAANGSLIDANPNEEKDRRTIDQLERLWDEMLLTGAGAQVSASNTINAFRQLKESEYFAYWRMRGVRPTGYDGSGNP